MVIMLVFKLGEFSFLSLYKAAQDNKINYHI